MKPLINNSLIAFLVLLACTNNYCQQCIFKFNITNQENQTIEFVSINIQDFQGNQLAAGYTDSLGNYEVTINQNSDSLLITVSSLGYKKIEKMFSCFSSENSYLDMQMEIEDYVLEGLTVTDKRKIISRDGSTYILNIGGKNDLGTNLSGILQNAPGVILTEQSLSLIGKEVKIEVNGKEVNYTNQQLLSFLKNKSFKNINKIELVLDPSSKYPASFDGRVINIITNDIDNGYTVSSYGDITRRSSFYSSSAGIDFNIRKNKLAVLSTFSYDISKMKERREYEQVLSAPLLDLSDKSTMDNSYVGPSYTLIADYDISKNYVIGFKYVGYNNDVKTNLYGSSQGIVNNELDFITKLEDSLNHKLNFNNFNLNQKLNFNNSTLNIDFDYGIQNLSGNSGQALNFFNKDAVFRSTRTIAQFIDNENIFSAGKIDFSTNLKSTTLKLGLGYNSTTNNNFINEESPFVPNNKLIDDINYKEDIFSTYQEVLTKISKIDVVLSNRIEITKFNGIISSNSYQIDSTYKNIFPRLKLSYNFKNHYITLSARRTIKRPRFTDFIPFKRYTGAFSLYTGNPALLAYFPKEVSFNYSYKESLWFNFSYQNSKNIISEFENLVDGIRQGIKVNNGVTQNYYYDIGYSKNLFKFYYLNSSLSLINGSRDITIDNEKINFQFNAYAVNIYNNLKFGKLNSSIGFYYSSPIFNSVSKTLDYWYLNFNIRYPILKDLGEISFSANDIFLTGITRSESKYADINLISTNNWDSRKFTFSLSYFFGKSDLKGARNRQSTANQSTLNRI